MVFGTEASIESAANAAVDVEKIQAVVGTERTDMAAAIRLGTAAFPETGQKRLVLMSDGNENIGDAMARCWRPSRWASRWMWCRWACARGNDVSVQKLSMPPKLKKGQTFEVKIFVQADQARPATVRLYRNEQYLGEQKVELSAGKNLFTFPQTLAEPGFYSYDVSGGSAGRHVAAEQSGQRSFTTVRGDPRVLVVSSDPDADKPLAGGAANRPAGSRSSSG